MRALLRPLATMAIDNPDLNLPVEREPRHSALEEFQRDERRPAVMLLLMLVIAALFFALGIIIGRWMAESDVRRSTGKPAATSPSPPSVLQ